MNTKARYPSGRFASSSEFRRWLNAQYPGGASQDEQTAALYGWQAGRKEAEARVKKLEEALQHISSAPCLYELLGEPPTDAEGEPAACECPGCVARRVLRVQVNRMEKRNERRAALLLPSV